MTTYLSITNRESETFKCLIDDIDADLLNVRWKVLKDKTSDVVYATRNIYEPKHTTVLMHRIIMARMLGRELAHHEQVDHKDLNGLNNTRANLRIATHGQNMANKTVQKNNKLGIKGVSSRYGKYRAQISVNGKRKHLGSFSTLEEAYTAYVTAAKEHYGEFYNEVTK